MEAITMSTRGRSEQKGSGNATGKSGNDSGSKVKEARGASYDERHGKHPSNKVSTGNKQSQRGGNKQG
jgi:hypothetical protein